MNMDIGAFDDSAVERAANQGQDWPPQHLVNYDYDAHLSGGNSLVDMNLNDDDDVMLGDIRSAEEQPLVSGDIDMDPRYARKSRKVAQRPKAGQAPRSQNANASAMNRMIKQGSGFRDALRAKMASQTKLQMDVHPRPEGNLTLSTWCVAVFFWIPIRYMCFLGCWALFVLPFLDVRFQSGMTFVEWLLYWYIQLFAIIGIFVESPTWILTRRMQLAIYKWCRLLRRTWGRAVFYLSVSFLTFAELQGGNSLTLSMLAGIYMSGVSMILMMFSVLAAKQYRLMYWYMATGGNTNMQDMQLVGDDYDMDDNAGAGKLDTQKVVSRVESYFDQLDVDRDGKIGAAEIHRFARESLQRQLSNAERHVIQMFLDCSCSGFVSKEDWVKQFVTYHEVNFL